MKTEKKWNVSAQEKEKYITEMTPQLSLLRSKVKINQDELASLIGVSRQTYGDIERGTKKMSWNTYLSLIMFFDSVHESHELIHVLNIFPETLIARFNDGKKYIRSQPVLPGQSMPVEEPIKADFDANSLLAQSYLAENRRVMDVVINTIKYLRATGPYRFEESCRKIFEATWDYLVNNPEASKFCFNYYYSSGFRKYAEEQHRQLLSGLIVEAEKYLAGISYNQDVVMMLFETLFSYSVSAVGNPERSNEIKKRAYVTYYALVDFYWKGRIRVSEENMVV